MRAQHSVRAVTFLRVSSIVWGLEREREWRCRGQWRGGGDVGGGRRDGGAEGTGKGTGKAKEGREKEERRREQTQIEWGAWSSAA